MAQIHPEEEPADRPSVGVVGLGSMGMGMARSLMAAGFAVHGCDVDPGARAALAERGGQVAAHPRDLAARVDTVLVIVVDERQVEAVLFGEHGLAAGWRGDGIVIQSSTISPAYARAAAARLAETGILFIDAPVSGGPARSADGTLTVMASGPDAAFVRAADILDAVAAKVYRLGDAEGRGSTLKMLNQLLAGVHIAAAAEAIAFGARAGIDPALLYDVVSNSAGNSWMFENRVPRILKGDYTPMSAVDIFVKDLGIVLQTGRDLVFPSPLAATAYQLFLTASASGYGRQDDAAVVKVFADLAGLDLPGKKDDHGAW